MLRFELATYPVPPLPQRVWDPAADGPTNIYEQGLQVTSVSAGLGLEANQPLQRPDLCEPRCAPHRDG